MIFSPASIFQSSVTEILRKNTITQAHVAKQTRQNKNKKRESDEKTVFFGGFQVGWAGQAVKTRRHVLCDGGSWLHHVCLALVCQSTTLN